MTFGCNGCSRFIDAVEKPKRCPHCNSKKVVKLTEGQME